MAKAALANEHPPKGCEGPIDPHRKKAADIARRLLAGALEESYDEAHRITMQAIDTEWAEFTLDRGPAPESDEMIWWRRLAKAEIQQRGTNRC